MKFLHLFIVIFFINITASFSQKVIKHAVKSGESVYAIAKKYDVTEKEIFDLNPKLKGSILSLKTVVQVPNKKYKPTEKKAKVVKNKTIEEVVIVDKNSSTISHLVSSKETLYSISKTYGVSMETICELNPELKVGPLKAGSRIKLPASEKSATSEKPKEMPVSQVEIVEKPVLADTSSDVEIIHKVLPKETLYGISKQYGVTVLDLQKNNPSVENGLAVGYDLIIKKGITKTEPEKTIVVIKDSIEFPEHVLDEGTDDILPLSAENLSKADFLIGKASEKIGTRYRSGGTTTAGFDCSGFMCYTFNNIDMKLPRSSREMAAIGTKIKRKKAQKGDLIFFATFGKGRISHVGMVTEVLDDEIKFIHSSTSSGVIISSTKEDYYARSFVQVNRVLQK